MKKQKLTSGFIITLVSLLLSFSANAQDKNLNNNLNGINSDSANFHNPRSPQSDQDIQKTPMNNMNNPPQSTLPNGQAGSLPSNNSQILTPARLNRIMPDSASIRPGSRSQMQLDSIQHSTPPKQ